VHAQGNLQLVNVQFISNTAQLAGGGAHAVGSIAVEGGLFQSNQCTQFGCGGGGLVTLSTLDMTGTTLISNDAYNGGGAYATFTVTLEGGRFEDNLAQFSGGGLYALSPLEISGTQFIANTAGSGGGLGHSRLAAPFGSPHGRVVNALFARNTATFAGAAMTLASSGNVEILHTTVAGPTQSSGAALSILSGTVGITNSVIASHTVGISLTAGTAHEDYNLFFGNGTNVVGGASAGGHSLSGDPRFADPQAGDYHLAFGSVARDAGTDAGVSVDVDGDARPQGSGFDIGFDEAIGAVLKIYLPLLRR
jgi:hypothetical protein